MCARAWSENSQLLFFLIWSPGMAELHAVSSTSSSLAGDIAGLERPVEPEDGQVVEQEQQLQAERTRRLLATRACPTMLAQAPFNPWHLSMGWL